MFPLKKIICPIDFDPRSKEIARFANEIATPMGSELLFAHVFKPSVMMAERKRTKMKDIDSDTFARKAEVALKAKLNKLISDFVPPQTDIKPLILKGNKASEIIKLAEQSDADLIVLSADRRSRFKKFLSGSDTDKVIRHSPCPVLAIHPERNNNRSSRPI